MFVGNQKLPISIINFDVCICSLLFISTVLILRRKCQCLHCCLYTSKALVVTSSRETLFERGLLFAAMSFHYCNLFQLKIYAFKINLSVKRICIDLYMECNKTLFPHGNKRKCLI